MKRILTGIITSNKTKDTVTVQVERILKHPKYQRRYKRHEKYKAQAVGEFSVGDKVQIKECKPISKDKKWKVIRVLVAAKKEDIAEDIADDVVEEKIEETKEEEKVNEDESSFPASTL